MHSLCIASSVRAYHERKRYPWLPMASAFRHATEGCDIPPLDIGVQAIPALAISPRRCRATAYMSSAVPRFTYMLLSPFPFRSRLVVRLGVICPELRPPLVAISSVRDAAHVSVSRGSPHSHSRACVNLQLRNLTFRLRDTQYITGLYHIS